MSVKKRVVYYLGGFDPRGVRHYHALYKEHFKKQSVINGMSGEVLSRKKVHNHLYQWEIKANDQGVNVHTLYNFLSWDDIVRSEWSSGIVSYYKDLIYCIIAYIGSGLVFSFAKASPKQMLAAFYPVIFLLGTLGVAMYGALSIAQWIGGWIGIGLGLGLGGVVIFLLEKVGNNIGVFWLLRIYAFSVRWGRGEIVSIEERINHFAHNIVMELDRSDDIDEVLLISHSVGTILAVSVLARVLEKKDKMDRFGMITLGECIPLVSFQPNAHSYRAELEKIGAHKDIRWIDYTAPIDGACFPLHDFMKSSGINTDNSDFPLFISPRFHTLFDKISYKKLRRDWYQTHFLYLMSTEISGEFDYYKISSGSMSIRDKIDRLKS